MEKSIDTPFDELPEALVEDMLNRCDKLGEKLSKSFRKLCDNKSSYREKLKKEKLLRKDSDLSSVPIYPTTVGVDGSYSIEKLLSTDIVAFAAVAVEGLTPPTEKRFWEKPRHFSEILTIPHSDSTTVVTRAIMMCMELELAIKAPHDVIFFDGSLTTPFIYLNQALNNISKVHEDLSELLHERLEYALKSYLEILLSEQNDKLFAGVPKYTTNKEVTNKILNIKGYEDRGFLSFILEANEFVGPLEIQKPEMEWHISLPNEMSELKKEIISSLKNLQVLYYRPFEHSPALRLEISQDVANNPNRLAALFDSLKIQCGAPGVLEPYPLYLADRMVKHLGTALPAIRKTTTQEMALQWEDILGNMYLAMHGYRTEWGK